MCASFIIHDEKIERKRERERVDMFCTLILVHKTTVVAERDMRVYFFLMKYESFEP